MNCLHALEKERKRLRVEGLGFRERGRLSRI